MQNRSMHIQGPQIHQFNNIAPQKMPRSVFKRDFTRRTTLNSDYLVPIFADEILPGDDMNLKFTAFTRMATPIKPVMDNVYQDSFFFFVPMRLLWTNWEKFQGQQTNPGDSVAYTIPKLALTGINGPSGTGFTAQSVYDYLGLPTYVNELDNVSCLFNRAYDLIWNEWFRNENLQNSLTIANSDGPDNPDNYQLRKRNKRKDYFTSCLPWPQKGDPVNVLSQGIHPVTGIAYLPNTDAVLRNAAAGGGSVITGFRNTSTNSADHTDSGTQTTGTTQNRWFNIPQTTINTTGLTVTTANLTINALRQAALYQQILELDARGGTRYVESIYSRFGVISPDFRLQRPELIGQGSSRVNIYAVPQTTPTVSGSTPQGNLAAFGTNVIAGHGCRYSATEHGIILGIMNIRADLTYQQGIPKMFSRRTRLDFYEPLLNGLGEQAVLKQEIVAAGGPSDTEVFGYQERFAEYRFKNSEITGKFRSTDPQSLDIWHLSQEFSGVPNLNSQFIEENVPMDRVLAVTNEPQFLMDMSFDYTHVRQMPIRSNPGITRL